MHQQTYKLAIKNPCQQDWNGMREINGGRHCNHCSKDVIDFSTYSKEAIIDFFIANTGKSVCCRMRKSQINTIEINTDLMVDNISIWKKFLIIFLIVFGYQLCGSSFVFAQILENDSAKVEKLNVVDSVKIDTIIPNQISINDSTLFYEEEKRKLEDSIAQLKKEMSSLELKDYKIEMTTLIFDKIDLNQMTMGFCVLLPKDELQPMLYPKTILESLIDEGKIVNKVDTREIVAVKNPTTPNNDNNKSSKPRDKNESPLVCILPNETQFKIGEEDGEI